MQIDGRMRLYCDSKPGINLSNNLVLYDRTKHVQIDRHFIKEKIDYGELALSYIQTQDQVTNIFTKAPSCNDFEKNITKLGMYDIYVNLRGSVEVHGLDLDPR